MIVERDFITSREGTTFIWRATVEGKPYCYQYTQREEYLSHAQPPLEFFEREAQRQIMRAIQRDLFKERTR